MVRGRVCAAHLAVLARRSAAATSLICAADNFTGVTGALAAGAGALLERIVPCPVMSKPDCAHIACDP